MTVAGFSRVEKLADDHDLSPFSCGKPVLDDWLRSWARRNQDYDNSTTWVVTPLRSRTVVGYYSLTMSSVERHEAPGPVRRNVPPQYAVSVVLLGRLAVDQRYQRMKLGRMLLRDVMLRVARAAEEIALRALMVHALDAEARRWYERWGFLPSPLVGDGDDELVPLFLPIKRIRVALEAAGLWPNTDGKV